MRKLTLKYKRVTKNTESIFEAEYEIETHVDQSSRELGLVSDYIFVIVTVVWLSSLSRCLTTSND